MDASDGIGHRLVEQAGWLDLLLTHLAGPRLCARVERDDLVQETFARAWSAADRLPRDEPGLRRYLARVARSVVFDALRGWRAAKRRGVEVSLDRSEWTRSGEGMAERVAAAITGPATRAVAAEEHRRLVAGYESLTAEHRRVIGLRQFEGRSAAESAARMGRSEAAIHSLYRRALQEWAARSRGR